MGWTGKILRIDLTNGTSKSEPLNMEWADKYLGQRGLASKYLSEEIDPKTDPLGPDNKVIFATGPLTGTCASTGGRYSVITKGPLTGAIACSKCRRTEICSTCLWTMRSSDHPRLRRRSRKLESAYKGCVRRGRGWKRRSSR